MSDYSMVQECTDHYEAQTQPDGSLQVNLRVPARYRDLWLARLSALRTTDAEIQEYEGLTDR